MNNQSPFANQSAPVPVAPFGCAVDVQTLTEKIIPRQLTALKENLEYLESVFEGMGHVDGKSPPSHPEDALVYLEDLIVSVKLANDVAEAWFDQDARRRKDG